MHGATAASAPALADPSTRWADLRLRLASALILGPAALACAVAGGAWWGGLLLLAFVGVCWEWGRLGRVGAGARAAGFVYALAAVVALFDLRSGRFGGRAALLFVLLVVWCSDVGAYVAGRLLGGRRLAPRISPGKTWSGAAGGLVAAIGAGTAVAAMSGSAPLAAIPVAALLGVASQLGDLGESALKRGLGVKDSGRLIPGHGGLLDRLDGLMAAALVACGWAWARGSGILP